MSNSSTKVPERAEIPADRKWDVEAIFKNAEEWEEAYAHVEQQLPDLQAFQGILTESAERLYEGLTRRDEVSMELEKVIVYAHLKSDEDTSDSFYQGLFDRARGLVSRFGATVAFYEPEILSASEETIAQWVNEHEPLQLYAHELALLNERRPHILPEKEEALLAKGSEVINQAGQAFSMLSDADLTFDSIEDEKGNETAVSNGRFIQLLQNNNRRVRKDAFQSLYRSYRGHENTLASLLSSQVKRNQFYTEARHYSSARAQALHDNHIPEKVYDQLVTVVNDHLHLFQRYLRLRKKLLELDDLHFYDLYVPLVESNDFDFDYEGAKAEITNALKPLGQDYIDAMTSGLQNGWVDVHENKGKSSGAYSSGAYLTQPYILMNWQDNIGEMYTLAHELGHSMHSYYTHKHQPYPYGDYVIFVAEVASTVNELLLSHALEQKAESKRNRLYLLNQQLEGFKGTVFRQTMFAEFEQLIHQKNAAGEALTPESLKAAYLDLNRKYFGEEITYDDDIALEWSRIPHFYMNFYVYQYATGYSAAVALSARILEEGAPAVERYLSFLKAGSSDYPIEILKKAGVDMTEPAPIEAAMTQFEKLLDEAEQLADDLLEA
ncbi:oligoendopeptidase F [Natribacillus halophilus]|uniref:Oligopeptidase F n=1 Tax=Natribacillus halophilus TaxID=549003 RepID=A0A1G8LFR1_9BACI|nr:oligoendopeptidase F [Natribacillus halophilus]SDI54493.1 oligopeptidase F. Metallo peptidase. MEROPS family M03B [Natribacillus halophilus]